MVPHRWYLNTEAKQEQQLVRSIHFKLLIPTKQQLVVPIVSLDAVAVADFDDEPFGEDYLSLHARDRVQIQPQTVETGWIWAIGGGSERGG